MWYNENKYLLYRLLFCLIFTKKNLFLNQNSDLKSGTLVVVEFQMLNTLKIKQL